MTTDANKTAWEEIKRRAAEDPEFKEQLIRDPVAVLKANGVELPEGLKEVKILVDTDEVRHLVLPIDDPEYDPGF